MTTTTMIHGVSNITCGTPEYTNCNAITLEFRSRDGRHSITLFDLDTETAELISETLSPYRSRKSEADIRADERRKIAARLGLSGDVGIAAE